MWSSNRTSFSHNLADLYSCRASVYLKCSFPLQPWNKPPDVRTTEVPNAQFPPFVSRSDYQ